MLNAFRTLTRSRIQPVRDPELARRTSVRLPGGISYPAGTILGERSSYTPANEVQTLTLTAASSGTFRIGVPIIYGHSKPTVALAYDATAAVVLAALQTILGVGNVTVTGSAGGPYTITFLGDYARSNVPLMTVYSNDTDGTIAIVRSTAGTPGPGLYAEYDDAASDGTQVAKAILEHDVTTDLSGRLVSEYGSGDLTVPAFTHGYFLCSQLAGLDAAAVADLGGLSQGSAYTDASAVLNVYKM